MPADDVAKALMAMDDEGIRAAVGAGDFAGLGDLTLDDAERTLLRDAAGDGDVEGFFVCDETPGMITCNGFLGKNFGVAVGYANKGLSPNFGGSFTDWTKGKQAQGGW